MAFDESKWAAYLPLTIDCTKIAAAMPDGGESGFPVVLIVDNAADINWEGDAANIFAKVNNYANDIAITLDDGSTQLKHTIVEYNGASGSELLVCHILVPSLASATDTTLRLYYRDDGTTDQQQTVYLAADGHKAYWPLHETSGQFLDISENGWHLDDNVSATGKTGTVGSGQEFDGTDDYAGRITSEDFRYNDWVTLMGWFKLSEVDVQYSVLAGNQADDYMERYGTSIIYNNVAQEIRCCGEANNSKESLNWSVADTNWHHIGCVFNASGILMGDGALRDSGDISDGWEAYYFALGCAAGHATGGGPGRFLDGCLDDWSVHTVARSADWIATTYNCQNDNDAFWTVGSEVLVPTGSVPVILRSSRPKITWGRMRG
ncbi:MAG: LamG-like jellyroll fold domain-containing protein [Candidatus Freyarchaeota archaeon]